MIQDIKPVVDLGVNMRCRFYPNPFPKENDLVVVEVVEVQENASYVELLEYDRIRGMITPNEMTKVLKGGMQKALKIGKQQIVRVLRVDEDQGYIDLSKKKVAFPEQTECQQKFANAKQVNSIMRSIAEKCKVNIEELYKNIVWPIYEKHSGEVLHVLKQMLTDQKQIVKLSISQEIRDKLMDEIERRLKPEPVTIRTEFELISFDYAGVLIIKEALLAGQAKGNQDCELTFEIKASPVYTGKTTTIHRDGLKIMKEALTEIENVIKSYKGLFRVKVEPKIIDGDPNQLQMQNIDEEMGEDEQYDDQQEEETEGDEEDEIGMQ